jgi:hypothetical protein
MRPKTGRRESYQHLRGGRRSPSMHRPALRAISHRTLIVNPPLTAVAALALIGCLAGAAEVAASAGGDLAIVNGRIYRSPDTAPIEHGTILVRGGRIAMVAAGDTVNPASALPVIDVGSLLSNTEVIRQRIAAGEVTGPRIYWPTRHR